ncbi:MAG TPA: diaminopimelate epimerase [Arenimonas sp.]|nr:diaminopimelate epimerase [Arenimonas sp.]
MSAAMPLRFSKMHGAGNHFLVLDRRGGLPPPSPSLVRILADPHTGVGFDQLLTIEDAPRAGVVARFGIWNADGSAAGQCGNGARCVAAWLRREGVVAGERFLLDSPAGELEVQCLADGRYRLAMGRPEFAPARIPFAATAEAKEYELETEAGRLRFGAVSMGNPHAVIEVSSAVQADVARLGPVLQARSEFPEGVNVGFAEVLAPDRIRLRVYERGAGETRACGSGACAAVVVLARRGRIGRHVWVELPGGTLEIDWQDDAAPVLMAGPAAFVFEGQWTGPDPESLE